MKPIKILKELNENIRLKMYNWYIIQDVYLDGTNGAYHIAQYYGREEGFECCVCNKGNNAFCFNIYYGPDAYETWPYGREHMPKIIKDLGSSKEQIIDNEENLEKYGIINESNLKESNNPELDRVMHEIKDEMKNQDTGTYDLSSNDENEMYKFIDNAVKPIVNDSNLDDKLKREIVGWMEADIRDNKRWSIRTGVKAIMDWYNVK